MLGGTAASSQFPQAGKCLFHKLHDALLPVCVCVCAYVRACLCVLGVIKGCRVACLSLIVCPPPQVAPQRLGSVSGLVSLGVLVSGNVRGCIHI